MRHLQPLLVLFPLQCLVTAEVWDSPDGPSLYSDGNGPDVYIANPAWEEYPVNESNHTDIQSFITSRDDDTVSISEAQDFYLRVMPLSASITEGMYSSDGNGYRKWLRDQLRYMGWKVNMVGSKNDGTMADNDNEGHPGWYVNQVHGAFTKSANLKPNLILINAGTSPATTTTNMKSMIDEIFETLPDTTVILSTIVQSGKGAAVEACAAATSQQYINLVANTYRGYRIAVADVHSAISMNQLADGTHPTDEGYKIFAAVWWNAISRVVDRIQPPINDGTVNDAEVTKSTTCRKITGTAAGPIKTQQGSGHDDGNYVHYSVDRGIIQSARINKNASYSGVPGSIPDYVFFANVVKGDENADRSQSLDDLILVDIDASRKMTWTFRQNLGAGGSFGSPKNFDVDLVCDLANNYAFADFNGDGLDDFFCIKDKAVVWVSLNRGGNPPKFESIGQVIGASDAEARQVRFADIDGDGRADFCLASGTDVKCSRNGGKFDDHFWQGFSSNAGVRGSVFSAKSGDVPGVFLGDLNGDYRADFLYIGDNGNVDTWVNQRGHGRGIVPEWRSAGRTHAGQADTGIQSNIKFGRIYGSGRLDYIYLKEVDDWYDVHVFENKGTGGTKRKGDGDNYCDMRGTGSDDLVWIYSNGTVDEINTNIHSPPNWGHSTHITLSVPGPRSRIHLADWTGDGKCDVLVQSEAGALTLYENRYDSNANSITFTNRGVVASTGCTAGWGVSMFDRGMRIADIEASGLFNAGQIKFAESWDRANLRFADVENSGRADIVWLNKYSGAGRVYKNNGYASGGAAGGSSFSWSDRGVLYSGVDRGETLHFANLGGLGRADLIQVVPETNVAYTNFNECLGGSGGDNGTVGNPGLPAYSAPDPAEIWTTAPTFASDPYPPYPPLKNDDGSDIAIENLRGTRLYGWDQCGNNWKPIAEAWKEFNSLASQAGIKADIDWNSDAALEFFGATTTTIGNDRKQYIQSIFDAASQMWSYKFTDILNPPLRAVPLEIPLDPGHMQRPGDDPGTVAYVTPNEGSRDYTKVTFCDLFFSDFKPLQTVTDNLNNNQDASARLNLTMWMYNRASVWLHEATHIDFFMGNDVPGRPQVVDLEFEYYKEIRQAYGVRDTKRLANYDYRNGAGLKSAVNADNYNLFALSKWAQTQSKEKKYPFKPYVSTLDFPTGRIWDIEFPPLGLTSDNGVLEFNHFPAPDVEP
ncbi:hypothetical protein E0Z10_g9703 [Xylaria hypoxylon]|uniref:SGNH hydrolase-type esterase domain-containing protein n=1 Tax=Xylaria hypoxylon TaxID=37992 RepID=A0A4Z0YRC1_9PEZI|nr:hypothetical protein E0Z10_g9703 [Xylaria hypoxylon]